MQRSQNASPGCDLDRLIVFHNGRRARASLPRLLRLLFLLKLLLLFPALPGAICAHGQETGSEKGTKAIVVIEKLALVRTGPGLLSTHEKRARNGTMVSIHECVIADGIEFCRVSGNASGWIQRESLALPSIEGEDMRLAGLVQASDGFQKLVRASIFIEHFPESPFRPLMLLLFGDLAEGVAAELTRRVSRSIDRNEAQVSGAPLISFYMNHPSLDRYRKLGVNYVINAQTLQLHYDGEVWKKLAKEFSGSDEAAEAEKRLNTLRANLAVKRQTSDEPD